MINQKMRCGLLLVMLGLIGSVRVWTDFIFLQLDIICGWERSSLLYISWVVLLMEIQEIKIKSCQTLC